MEQVLIAVVRRVKPGSEKAFEDALRDFARESLREPGTTGVHLIGPVTGDAPCEYGILRSFESEAASRSFYESERFVKWQEQIAEFAEGEPIKRKLHGLEAFFLDNQQAPPPRWRMATVTWLGVFPTVLLWSSVLPPVLGNLPYLAVMAVVNVFIVITLTWGVMPILTRLLAGWLHGRSPHS